MRAALRRRPVVLIPDQILKENAVGPLYGYAHLAPLTFNVISSDPAIERPEVFRPCTQIGEIYPIEALARQSDSLVGWYSEKGLECLYNGESCRVEAYSLVLDIFSRNTGIVESRTLLNSGAVISGCGSVGSLVALELARAGVGKFLLIDNDVLSYHNLCRHQCGIADVGRFKTDALRDRILDINPTAQVCSRQEMVESTPKEVFDEWCRAPSVMVGCADNREGDLYLNRISCLYRIPFVSIGLWERAFAGEIFWSIPGKTACYHCAFGRQDQTNLSYRTSTSRRIYTNRAEIDMVAFEPGISIDIDFVTMIGLKIALDLLLKAAKPGSHVRTLDSLTQFTLVCNTRDPHNGGSLAEIFSYPLQITRSIEVEKLEGCPHCSLVCGPKDAT
jgi:molybdopterin/thiamine biosynthesis adenylyltransferase